MHVAAKPDEIAKLPAATPPLADKLAPEEGSWDPDGAWGVNGGGRIMTTSLSLLTLEVYYRHTPLYRAIRETTRIRNDNRARPAREPLSGGGRFATKSAYTGMTGLRGPGFPGGGAPVRVD